jgi:hypothetical protein
LHKLGQLALQRAHKIAPPDRKLDEKIAVRRSLATLGADPKRLCESSVPDICGALLVAFDLARLGHDSLCR